MSRKIHILAECIPPANLVAIGATPEKMSKTVDEKDAADAAREFADACYRTGIFSCHGTVMMSFSVVADKAGDVRGD